MAAEYQRTCDECETRLSACARYCSMCGNRVRSLEEFETPVDP